jgi:glucokinase
VRLGIDIGGTKTDAVAVEDSGEVIQRVRLPTGFGSVAVVETAVSAMTQIAELTHLGIADFDSIGVGIPGMVDGDSGHVRHAVNLGFDGLDLGSRLADRFGVGVRVENDVTAAAVGAYHLLELTSSLAYLNVGTGIAAGLVVNGRPWRGSRGSAGEVGHIPIDPDGVMCGCGQRGCLETLASGSSVVRQWPSTAQYPVLELFDAADAGDAKALAIRAGLANGVASAVRILVLTADVDTVVIGGGLSHLGDRLHRDIDRVFAEWADSSTFLSSLELAPRVQLVPEGLPVAAVGAAFVGKP